MRWKRAVAGVALAALLALGAGSVSAHAGGGAGGAHWTVVASGLDNPRDLAFRGGRLYVAEAGHGGGHCAPDGTCLGLTSKLSVVNFDRHRAVPVVTHLASVTDKTGFAAIGLDGVSVSEGRIFAIMAGAKDQVPPGVFPAWLTGKAKAQLGRLIQASPNGHWRSIADVGHHDFVWAGNHQNLVPGQFPDANPYGVFAAGGRTQWVVDAGANTIDRVRNGHVQIVKFVPNPPVASDSVPTCIDRGPDGALYIGQLTGDGNPPGSANVYRFDPKTRQLRVWASGLSLITGCGFDSRGHFIAVEISASGDYAPNSGAVVRVPAHSTTPVTIVGGLDYPGGFAAGRHGSIYVSNGSINPTSAGGGQVIRITQ